MQLFLLAFSVLLFCEYRAEDVADYDPTYALLQAGSDTHFEPIPVQITHWSNWRNLSTPVNSIRTKRSHRVPHSGESKYMKYLMLAAACVIIYAVFQTCYCICEKKRKENTLHDLGKLDKVNKHDGPSDNNQDSEIHADPFAGACPKLKAIMERQHSYVKFGKWEFFFNVPKCDCCRDHMLIEKFWCIYCYQQVHGGCQSQLEVPCIPKKKNEEMVKYMVDERLIKCERDSYETEDKRLKEQRDLPTDKWRYLTIPDLTHMHAVPQIPQQLIKCVKALDEHFLHLETLYMDTKETWEQGYNFLKSLYAKRQVPVIIDTVPPYIITSAIKVILAHMTEALIRFGDKVDKKKLYTISNYLSNQDSFLKALNAKKEEQESAIISAFNKLQVGCEQLTLAFMMIHWKRVLAHSDKNKITVDRLAQSIGHFVIRHVDCVEVTKMLLQAKMV